VIPTLTGEPTAQKIILDLILESGPRAAAAKPFRRTTLVNFVNNLVLKGKNAASSKRLVRAILNDLLVYSFFSLLVLR